LVLLKLDDVANCVAAGVDVGEPAGIFHTAGVDASEKNTFPLESNAIPYVDGAGDGDTGIVVIGDAAKGADVGNNEGASVVGACVGVYEGFDGRGVGATVGTEMPVMVNT